MAIIRIARLWHAADPAPVARPAVVQAEPGLDSLEAFGSEAALPFPAPAPRTASSDITTPETTEPPRRTAAAIGAAARWVAVALLSASAAAAGVWKYQERRAAQATGSLTIQTTPAGLDVLVDGRPSGVTPLTVHLAPATYAIQVGKDAQRRDLQVAVTGGSSILQHLDMPAPVAAAAPATGALRIQTDTPGQTISVGGEDRGVSPLTIEALPPGEHSVVARGPRGSVRRTVTVKAGETLALFMAPAAAPAAPAAGWISVKAAARLELRENAKLIGTTDTEQIMLPAGEHVIEIVNDAIGYRSTRVIEVASGKTTAVAVDLPFGSLSLNAQPWAEVWIGGERIGDTPIANLARRVGSYEVVFRHPELGERRETVLVTLRQPVRLGIDMRSRQP